DGQALLQRQPEHTSAGREAETPARQHATQAQHRSGRKRNPERHPPDHQRNRRGPAQLGLGPVDAKGGGASGSARSYKKVRPSDMITPETNSWIRQNPMMSLAFRPAMASTGKAQKGCSILVQPSPHATAMATRGMSAPSACAEAMTTSLCTAHWPPPEGTKILTRPALMKVQKASVFSVASDTIHSDRVAA